MENILVIGLGKTGTTVISKTICNSLPKAEYILEPKEIPLFEAPLHENREIPAVVKMLFDHWIAKPRMRNAIVHNEARLKFGKRISITRDPRDELISRLYYVIKPYFDSKVEYFKQNPQEKETAIEKWIQIFQEKETNPGKTSIVSMNQKLQDAFGVNLLKDHRLNTQYSNFLSNTTVLFNVKYEDFINGNRLELENYLGFDLSENKDMGNLEYTKRSEGVNNWKKYFTETDVVFFKKFFSDLGGMYALDDWELNTDKRIDSKHGSKYQRGLLSSS